MFKGGYKLIDFKETNITLATPSTIKGVYEAIENNYRKPTLITGLVIGNDTRRRDKVPGQASGI